MDWANWTLFTPIACTFAFSFNDAGKSNLVWRGFALANWANPCGAPAVCESVVNSPEIGVPATVISTVLGTVIAITLVRYRITNFNSGDTDTFPKFVYVSATRGIPPQANVMGSAMFVPSNQV